MAREAVEQATRQVDKTEQDNKYSVPMPYQQVRVREQGGTLAVHDLESGEVVATHALHLTSRNEAPYHDLRQQEADLEQTIARRLGEPLRRQLCKRPREGVPLHDKD